jgi:hypothetical protein
MLSVVRPVKGAREIIRRCKHLRGERQRPEIVDLDVKIGKDANVHGFALLSLKPVLSSGHRQSLIGPLALAPAREFPQKAKPLLRLPMIFKAISFSILVPSGA